MNTKYQFTIEYPNKSKICCNPISYKTQTSIKIKTPLYVHSNGKVQPIAMYTHSINHQV